jgi:hypothetical protein
MRDLTGEIAAVRVELGRVDTKAATLLALVGAGLAVAVSVIPGEVTPTAVAGVLLWVAAGASVASIIVLLLCIRPVLSAAGFGFPSYAGSVPEPSQRNDNPQDRRVAELTFLSGLLVRKYHLVRLAVDALFASLAVLLAAVVVLAV